MLIFVVYFMAQFIVDIHCKTSADIQPKSLIQRLNSTANQAVPNSTRTSFGRILQSKPDLSDFPHYLYDTPSPHEKPAEVTSTESPNKKRVSGTHYSYYYLGRKLWYVPLYFSIYFMFYVTALVLKAIARHKIQLKHEHALGKGRSGRSMVSHQMDRIDEIHKDISIALARAHRKIYINTFG